MLIIDYARKDGGKERVGAVGSCRIHDPLKAAARDGRGAFLWSAFNTFTHTPPEAVQHISFCRGLLEIPDPFAPFIMRLEQTPFIDERLPQLVDSCTAFMVEMSSVDILKCGYYYFNQDYFSQVFVRGAGMGMLNWFRSLSETPASADRVAEAVAALKEKGAPIRISTEEVLRSTITAPLSPKSFRESLASVAFDAKKRWIFVPHFNISENPDEQIAKRRTLSSLLEASAKALGFEFYDPTPIVAKAGRAQALEGGGADTFHYAPAFLPTIGEGLYQAIMAPGVAGGAPKDV